MKAILWAVALMLLLAGCGNPDLAAIHNKIMVDRVIVFDDCSTAVVTKAE